MNSLELISNVGRINPTDIKDIIEHISRHHKNQNLHLRKTKQLNNEKILLSLHMAKYISPSEFEGHFSGPNNLQLLYQFEIRQNQVYISIGEGYSGNQKDLKRICKNLIKWLKSRIVEESTPREEFFSNYSEGEFYLRRSRTKYGHNIDHPSVQKALSLGIISKEFAFKLEDWGFEIINP